MEDVTKTPPTTETDSVDTIAQPSQVEAVASKEYSTSIVPQLAHKTYKGAIEPLRPTLRSLSVMNVEVIHIFIFFILILMIFYVPFKDSRKS